MRVHRIIHSDRLMNHYSPILRLTPLTVKRDTLYPFKPMESPDFSANDRSDSDSAI